MKNKSKYQLIKLFVAALMLINGSDIRAQVLLLTPSYYHGYHVSCFGVKDGSINMTIIGCVPPYTIRWSNKDTAQNISDLSAGDYFVHVTDSQNHELYAVITLTQPNRIKIAFTPSDNRADQGNYNTNQPDVFSGMITSSIEGGVMPYYYIWRPFGQKTLKINSLAAGKYTLVVSDANGCTVSKSHILTEPVNY